MNKLRAIAACHQKQKAAAKTTALEAELAKLKLEITNLKRLLAEYADLRDWKRSAEKARITINTTVARRAKQYLHELAGP